MTPPPTTHGEEYGPLAELSRDCTIPIILNIDVEPDGFFINRHQQLPWTGYEASTPIIEELREQVLRATGRTAHFTWLFRLDPQVAETYGSPDWPLQQYSRMVQDARMHGDEIGLHVHPFRWDERRDKWVAEYGDQQWVDHCLQLSASAFRQSQGATCRTASMGNHWMSNRTVELMEELGIRYELTVLSETTENGFTQGLGRFTGEVQDYAKVPRFPYHPTAADFRVPDYRRKDGIWMVPLSTQVRGLRRSWPNGLVETLKDKFVRRQPLSSKFLIRKGPGNFRDSFEYLVNNVQRPYFSFSIRSALFGIPQLVQNLRDCFDFLLTHPEAKRFSLTTPAETVRMLGCEQSDKPKTVAQSAAT